MKSPVVSAYLEKYAEPGIRHASVLPAIYSTAVVVPCFGENEILGDCVACLNVAASALPARVLVILLVNGNNETPIYGEKNRQLLNRLRPEAQTPEPLERSYLITHFASHLDLLLVDKTVEGSLPSQGVGWARKFGCDLALRWIDDGIVASPWIHTTDADARVASDYFDFSKKTLVKGLGKEVGVVLHPFLHEGAVLKGAGEEESPIGLYDLWLRYYEAGLRFAGSPYAFPTIGSLVSIHAKTYAEVRGFPKREAAEDFYLLAKAAKVASVVIGGGGVTLRDRASARVPFGTGVGVKKIADRLQAGSEFTLYHPESFKWLKLAIAKADSDPLDFEMEVPEGVRTALDRSGYFSALKEANGRKTAADRYRTFHASWDAFKTLKFIHLLRESGWPEINWRKAVVEAAASEITFVHAS